MSTYWYQKHNKEPHWQTRLRLWEQDPRCIWCGRETLLVNPIPLRGIGQPPALMATREHVFSRFYHQPRTFNPPKVLACQECNTERSRFEMAVLKQLELEKFNYKTWEILNKVFKRFRQKLYGQSD